MMAHEHAAELRSATNWRKSGYSGGQNTGCVEVGTASHLVGVRDTVLGDRSPVLIFTVGAWTSFLDGLRGRAEMARPALHPHDAPVSVETGTARTKAKQDSHLDPRGLQWDSPADRRLDGECEGVEIAPLPHGGRAVRNAGDGNESPVLYFTSVEWNAFISGVNDGEFDLQETGEFSVEPV